MLYLYVLSAMQQIYRIFLNLLSASPFPQILELKSQNRNLNSLLCEIFTNLAVKIQKSGNQQKNTPHKNYAPRT